MDSPLDRAVLAFRRSYGRSPERAARAPGRVNLIGEHTDYNEGLVLPCAIDRDTLALVARRRDRRLRALALDLGAGVELELDALRPMGGWAAYVAAPFAALAEAGFAPGGADLLVTSRVPRESGLSSSAALGVVVATALRALFELELDDRALADVVHRGESRFVGVGCGILDMYASALGRRGHALRIDCRDRSVAPVLLGAGSVRLLVAHSGVTRALAQGGYRERVRECQEALEIARRSGVAGPQVRALRDFGPQDLAALERVLPPRLLGRVRHVVRENLRVEALCQALEREQWTEAGAILDAGMASLRDDYQVSVPELDLLCELAAAQPGVLGSRLTGAGFGGCTLHLVRGEAAEAASDGLRAGFRARYGREPRVWIVEPADGAGLLPL